MTVVVALISVAYRKFRGSKEKAARHLPDRLTNSQLLDCCFEDLFAEHFVHQCFAGGGWQCDC
jgi:hypothetical protein